MTVKGKGGSSMILQPQNVMHPVMWCSMRRLHGGPRQGCIAKLICFKKMTYNLLKISCGMENLRLQMMKV